MVLATRAAETLPAEPSAHLGGYRSQVAPIEQVRDHTEGGDCAQRGDYRGNDVKEPAAAGEGDRNQAPDGGNRSRPPMSPSVDGR